MVVAHGNQAQLEYAKKRRLRATSAVVIQRAYRCERCKALSRLTP